MFIEYCNILWAHPTFSGNENWRKKIFSDVNEDAFARHVFVGA